MVRVDVEDAMTETRPLSTLRPHPENATIFGDPEESPEFDGILASIKAHGMWDPIVIKPDGTILSGHLRRAAAGKLRLREVPVRVAPAFADYRDEVTFVVRSNTDRRQLTKGEIALAFKRLRELPKAQGGTAGKRGGDRRSAAAKEQSGSRSTLKAREEAASILGVGEQEARALETVFATPGVPDELKRAVNQGTIAPTPAAKAVRTEVKRQGGAITDPAGLRAVAAPPPPATPSGHEDRVAREAKKYGRRYAELLKLYSELDGILTSMPLKSLLGPTEHHEYGGLIRSVALRAWREIETVEGKTNAGRQMALSVIDGGRR